MDPDLELLERWRDGDKKAGGDLLTKYFGDLQSYFAARLAEYDQEDLIQDVFVRMVEARDRFQGLSTFRTYMFSVARNVFRERLRARYRGKGHFDPLAESIADVSGRTQSSILAEKEEHQRLLDALRAIPSEKQDLLELRYFHGLSHRQLAELFEVPTGTVKSRLVAARALLCEHFKRAGRIRTNEDIERELREVSQVVHRGLTRTT